MGRMIKEFIDKLEEFVSTLDASQHTPEPPDDLLAAMIELEAADDDSDCDEPFAMVGARVRPRPYLGSGAIALHEPDDHYPIT